MNVLRSVVPNQAWLLKGRGVVLSIGGYCFVFIVLLLLLVVALDFSSSPSEAKRGRFAYSSSISRPRHQRQSGDASLTRPRFLVLAFRGKAGTLRFLSSRIDAERFRRNELVKVLVIGS